MYHTGVAGEARTRLEHVPHLRCSRCWLQAYSALRAGLTFAALRRWAVDTARGSGQDGAQRGLELIRLGKMGRSSLSRLGAKLRRYKGVGANRGIGVHIVASRGFEDLPTSDWAGLRWSEEKGTGLKTRHYSHCGHYK
jgi:hypothetical protein